MSEEKRPTHLDEGTTVSIRTVAFVIIPAVVYILTLAASHGILSLRMAFLEDAIAAKASKESVEAVQEQWKEWKRLDEKRQEARAELEREILERLPPKAK